MTEAAVARANVCANGLKHVCTVKFTIPEITALVEDFDFNIKDMKDGKKNPDLFFAIDELLEAFCDDHREKLDRLKQYKCPADFEAQQIACHGIAGAAANLALEGIRKPARLLGQACKAISEGPAERTRDPVVCEEIQALYEDVITRLVCLITWFDAHGVRGSGDDDEDE